MKPRSTQYMAGHITMVVTDVENAQHLTEHLKQIELTGKCIYLFLKNFVPC